MTIKAGKKEDVLWSPDEWIFIDIGFSNNKKSCGYLVGDNEPENLRYGEMVRRLLGDLEARELANIVIEAPLSVAMDKFKNPVARNFERIGIRTRYWYAGLGCGVLLAALRLIKDLHDAKLNSSIHVFEGFVSFKAAGVSDHKKDVRHLRDIVKTAKVKTDQILAPSSLTTDPSHELESAFKLLNIGLDDEIPAVLLYVSDLEAESPKIDQTSLIDC